MTHVDQQYVGVRETARILGLHEDSVRRLVSKGRIPGAKRLLIGERRVSIRIPLKWVMGQDDSPRHDGDAA